MNKECVNLIRSICNYAKPIENDQNYIIMAEQCGSLIDYLSNEQPNIDVLRNILLILCDIYKDYTDKSSCLEEIELFRVFTELFGKLSSSAQFTQVLSSRNKLESLSNLAKRIQERYSIVRESNQPIIYPSRWYILIAFSIFSAFQATYWGLLGTFADAAFETYSFTTTDVSIYGLWGPIGFIPLAPFWSWVMDTKGLRMAVLSAQLLALIGAAFRAFVVNTTYAKLLFHIGGLINGLGGAVAMGGVAKLSESWFPVSERTMATGIGSCANPLGVGIGLLMGPVFIRGANPNQILTYMRFHLGIALLLFISILIYFPSIPPTPPSNSAIQRKEGNPLSTPSLITPLIPHNNQQKHLTLREFLKMCQNLFKNKDFLIVGISYGAVAGVYAAWSGILDVSLLSLHVSDDDSDFIGSMGIFIGCIGGPLLGYIVDRSSKPIHRQVLISILSISAVSFGVLALIGSQSIPASLPLIFITAIIGSVLLLASIPLFYELAIEVAFPVLEGTVCSVITSGANFFIVLFLAFPPSVFGTIWMNYALTAVCSAAAIILSVTKSRYKRLELDRPLSSSMSIE